eukprot:TRINITY_DN50988_c0_g1_i1.p2 TRINITY_DN50988_c0_g1~~TRINITY_DN50988_c0_g1_i1.p2  ORF type:complete len:143 (+),score=25.12 TRINITY_DN50988_c0_g1_i1:216-644(+)
MTESRGFSTGSDCVPCESASGSRPGDRALSALGETEMLVVEAEVPRADDEMLEEDGQEQGLQPGAGKPLHRHEAARAQASDAAAAEEEEDAFFGGRYFAELTSPPSSPKHTSELEGGSPSYECHVNRPDDLSIFCGTNTSQP